MPTPTPARRTTLLLALAAATLAVLAVVLPATTTTTLAKTVSGRVTAENSKTYNLGKFTFRPPGEAIINGRITYRAEAAGHLYIFQDTEWDKYHSNSDDCTRMSAATSKLEIGRVTPQPTDHDVGKGLLYSQVDTENPSENVWTFRWTIDHRMRPYGYYLVYADCTPYHTGKGSRYKVIGYDVSFLNPGEDHFPADEYGLLTLYVLSFLALVGYGVYAVVVTPGAFADGRDDSRPPGMVTVLVTIAYVTEIFSLSSEIMHLWYYSSNGYGVFAFDFLSEILEGVSQIMIAYLLIAFACGWTIIEGAVTAKHQTPINPEALGEDHVATVFMFFIVLITFVLQLLNKVVLHDDFTKFHDYESWPGFIHVGVRAALASLFTYQVGQTISYQSRGGARAGSTKLLFIRRLALLGGLWFWCFPFLVALATVFAHYLRHRLVTGGVLVLQTGSLVLLAQQITRHTSSYARVNVSSSGAVLPGAFKAA